MFLKQDHIPIFDTDYAVSGFDWRYLMDTYVANYGHEGVTKAKLKLHLKDLLKEITEDAFDSFDYLADELVRETENS